VRKIWLVLYVLIVGAGCLVGGCVVAAVGAGAGTVAYVRGDLESVESHTLDEVYTATKKAVEKLELHLIEAKKDAMTGEVEVRDAQDKKILIKLAATAEKTTKISIRVGLFGSETKSRLIYDEIRENLK